MLSQKIIRHVISEGLGNGGGVAAPELRMRE